MEKAFAPNAPLNRNLQNDNPSCLYQWKNSSSTAAQR